MLRLSTYVRFAYAASNGSLELDTTKTIKTRTTPLFIPSNPAPSHQTQVSAHVNREDSRALQQKQHDDNSGLTGCTLRPMPALSVAMTGSRKPPSSAQAAVRSSPRMRFVSCTANVLEASSLLNLCQSTERRSRDGGRGRTEGPMVKRTSGNFCMSREDHAHTERAGIIRQHIHRASRHLC